MRFNQDSTSAAHVIRAYRQGEIKIDAEAHQQSVLISASSLERVPEIGSASDLDADETARAVTARLLALRPEIVLIGTGARQVFPPARIRAPFLEAGIGIEVMDSGAACRTFNVLVAEGRRVAALIVV
jgi:uncharacterized protein